MSEKNPFVLPFVVKVICTQHLLDSNSLVLIRDTVYDQFTTDSFFSISANLKLLLLFPVGEKPHIMINFILRFHV